MSKTTYMFTNPISCHGCRVMDKVLEENPDIDVTIADITTEEGAMLATTYRIMGGLPAFVRVDQDENVSAVWNGTMTEAGLREFVSGNVRGGA